MKVAPEATVRYFGNKDGFNITTSTSSGHEQHVDYCLSPYFMVESQNKLLVGSFPLLHETQERLRA